MDDFVQWELVLKEIVEDAKKQISESYPDLTDEQLNDVFEERKPKLIDSIIEQIEVSLLASIEKLELPSEEKVRLSYRQKIDRAHRSRTAIRQQKIREAELTRGTIYELEAIRERYLDENNTQKAAEYADHKRKWKDASSVMNYILDVADGDNSTDLTRNEEAEDRTRRRMRGIIKDDDEE